MTQPDQPSNGNNDPEGEPADRGRLERMRLIARAAASDLADRPGVLAVWLIGSVYRGNIWKGSDIDLQVMVKKVRRRIECRRIDGEDIIVKFVTRNQLERSILGDGDDPVICAMRDSTILHDPHGYVARLKMHAAQACLSRSTKLAETIERLEETWEDWQRADKAYCKGDQPALALRVTCITGSMMGLLYALEGIRIPSYTPTEENLARLADTERQGLRDCLGVTGLGLEARFEQLTNMLDKATERIAQVYGEDIARLVKGREMTQRDIEEELGAGLPRQLVKVLVEKGLLSMSRRPIEISGTAFYEEVYSTPPNP